MVARWITLATFLLAAFAGALRANPPSAPIEPAAPRIVSTVPAATLNLVLIGAGDRLVGVSRYDRDSLPDNLKDLPIVGDYLTLGYEQLLGLHPTALVIQVAPNRIEQRLADTCASHHIELVNMKFDHIADIWPSVRALGKAAGKEPAAEAAITRAQDDIQALTAEVSAPGMLKPRVLYLVSANLMITAGKDSFIDEMITLAGGDNAGAGMGSGFPEINREAIINLAPDVLLIGALDEEGLKGNDPRLAAWLALPIPAARNHRIHLITDPNALKASVNIGQNIRMLAGLIHQPGHATADAARTTGWWPVASAGFAMLLAFIMIGRLRSQHRPSNHGGPALKGVIRGAHISQLWLAWLLILAAAFALCIMVGEDASNHIIRFGWPSPNIFEGRLPRVIAAAIVGFGLAGAGVTLQALLRNPLADPYVLGISSGSAVGMMIWLLFFGVAAPAQSLPAVAGAVATCIVVFTLARGRWAGGSAEGGGGIEPITLLLVGVVVSAMNAAFLMILNSLAPAGINADMATYLLGSILENNLSHGMLWAAGITLVVGYLPVLIAAPALNIGSLSDLEATSLGINAKTLRTISFICASIMTAAALLLSGPIGFVGLICPHICRRLMGADHRLLLISAPLCGAAFLMLADTAARLSLVLKHGQFHVGVVTALCGGPFFLFLLRRR